MRRLALIIVVPLLAGCGSTSHHDRPTGERGQSASAQPAATAATGDAPRRTRTRPRLPSGRTVPGALRRAQLAGHLPRDRAAAYRRIDRRARSLVRRLGGRRRAELGAVIRTLDGLAASGRLSASRMPLAFLTLRRNVEVWRRPSLPRPGERLTFGRDPLVFQAFAGRGVQHHPLASFGRANALGRVCLEGGSRAAGPRCRPRALRRLLDRLVAIAARRGGATAWEHQFAYGGGAPLWVSAMTQGTAVQALARGSLLLRRGRYLRVAESALGVFEQPPPAGVSVPAPGGRQYVMYSFDPQLRILNGFLQSVIGLHDMARLSGSRRAARVYRAGERAARAAVAAYDTGAWSLYSSAGRESSLDYHRLVHGFLDGLCTRTGHAVYCRAQRRFGRYLGEPPRIRLAMARRARPRQPVAVKFTLSKIARVAVHVRGPKGTAMRRRLTLPRGPHRLAWTPRRRGAYRVRVQATGLSGPRGVARRTVQVRPRARSRLRTHVRARVRAGLAQGDR